MSQYWGEKCWSKPFVKWVNFISISKHNVCLSASSECCCSISFWSVHISSSIKTGPRLLSVHTSSAFCCSTKAPPITVLSLLFSPQEYQIDIIFAQTWVDTRLRFNSSSSRRLTLNRYAGFTVDVQLDFKFPHLSAVLVPRRALCIHNHSIFSSTMGFLCFFKK